MNGPIHSYELSVHIVLGFYQNMVKHLKMNVDKLINILINI